MIIIGSINYPGCGRFFLDGSWLSFNELSVNLMKRMVVPFICCLWGLFEGSDLEGKHSYFSPISCHLIVVGEFACPNETGSYVARGFKPLVGSPKANRS